MAWRHLTSAFYLTHESDGPYIDIIKSLRLTMESEVSAPLRWAKYQAAASVRPSEVEEGLIWILHQMERPFNTLSHHAQNASVNNKMAVVWAKESELKQK